MLGKQFWRLIEKPNTIFFHVFKGQYFRNASPMERVRSYSSSYGWGSIVSARSLVSKWLIKRVGLRSYISVWNDLWLPSTRSRPANKNQHNLYSDLTVDSLIDVTSKNMEFTGYSDSGGPARCKNYWEYSFKSISGRRSGWMAFY